MRCNISCVMGRGEFRKEWKGKSDDQLARCNLANIADDEALEAISLQYQKLAEKEIEVIKGNNFSLKEINQSYAQKLDQMEEKLRKATNDQQSVLLSKERRMLEGSAFQKVADHKLSCLKEDYQRLSNEYQDIILDVFDIKCSYDEIVDKVHYLSEKVEAGNRIFKELKSDCAKQEAHIRELEKQKLETENLLGIAECEKEEANMALNIVQDKLNQSTKFQSLFSEEFKSLCQKTATLARLRDEATDADKDSKITQLEKENKELRFELDRARSKLQEVGSSRELLERLFSEQGKQIADYLSSFEHCINKIDESTAKQEIELLNKQLENCSEKNDQLYEEMRNKDEEIVRLKQELKLRDYKISELILMESQEERTLHIARPTDQSTHQYVERKSSVCVCQECTFSVKKRQKCFTCAVCQRKWHQKCIPNQHRANGRCQDCST